MRIVVAFAALLLAVPAIAGTCGPVKEYGQLKDQARTAPGRARLANSYCLFAELRQFQQRASDRSECMEHMTKIADALEAAKDRRNLERALACASAKPAK